MTDNPYKRLKELTQILGQPCAWPRPKLPVMLWIHGGAYTSGSANPFSPEAR